MSVLFATLRPCALTLALFAAACGPQREALPDDPSPGDPAAQTPDEEVPPPPGVFTVELAGRALDVAPGFSAVRTFQPNGFVHIGIDPSVASLAGKTCDAWVTPDRSDWDADPALTDVRGAPSTLEIPANATGLLRFDLVSAGALDAFGTRGTGQGYDLVLDCDRDGTLSAGDVIDGVASAGFYVVPDLTTPGPHAVQTVSHQGGEWRQLVVYHPSDIETLPGPLPVVMVAHGYGHALDYYGHLGEHLASYGYVVASFRNDVGDGDGNGTRTAATTLLENTGYLLANQASIGDGALAGRLDADRIVWVGHSTGGECVVHAYTRLATGSFTSPWFDADSIALVSSMAPVAWLPREQSDPLDVNYHLITGGADRDTGNYPEPGYTQNMALFERARGNRHLTYIHGAGHGDLHDGPQNWLDQPEPQAPGLIGPEGAHPVVLSTHLALAELYTRDNEAMRDFFERAAHFRPQGIPADVVTSHEYKPAVTGDVVVIDDFQTGDLATTSAGRPVWSDVDHAAEVRMQDTDWSYDWTGQQPSNGMTRAKAPGDDARALVFDHDGPASLELGIAPDAPIDPDGALMFRIGQGTRHPFTIANDGPVTFTVVLRDVHGVEAALPSHPYGTVRPPYARPGSGNGAGWANELTTLRMPLADFAAMAPIDLSALESVRFELGGDRGTSRARLALDDVLVAP